MSTLPYPPFNLLYLASAASATDIEIKLFDFNMTHWMGKPLPWNEIEADIIGVSANFSLHHTKYISFLRQLRRRFPSTLIIVGGVHATGIPSLFSSSRYCDYVVVGNGEILINNIKKILKKNQEIPKILNVNYTAKNSFRLSFHHDNYFKYLEKLNIAQYDNFYLKYPSILYKGLPSRQVFFNRKCPFSCTHCVETLTSSRITYDINIEHTIEDIAIRNKESETPHCYFLDPTLNSNRNSIIHLCNSINSKFPHLIWGCKARIELLDKELIRVMARAGCRFVEVGLEAFDENALDDIGKPHIGNSFFSNLDLLSAHDISIQCNFMLGLPRDTPSVLESRVEFAHRMIDSYNLLPCFWLFCPFPGSELWNQMKLDGKDINWDNISTAPVLKYGKIRNEYAYLPQEVSNYQMSRILQYAWNMPKKPIEKWFKNNYLFQIVAKEYKISVESLLRFMFPKRIGDFIHSKFFIVQGGNSYGRRSSRIL